MLLILVLNSMQQWGQGKCGVSSWYITDSFLKETNKSLTSMWMLWHCSMCENRQTVFPEQAGIE